MFLQWVVLMDWRFFLWVFSDGDIYGVVGI